MVWRGAFCSAALGVAGCGTAMNPPLLAVAEAKQANAVCQSEPAGASISSAPRPLYLQIVNPADKAPERAADTAPATTEPSAGPDEARAAPPAGQRMRSFELPPVNVVGERPRELK